MSYTLDNEVLLGILFNGTMEINISVIAVCILFDKLKIIKKNLFAFNTAFGKLTNTASCTRCEIPVVTQNNGSTD